MDMLQPDLWNVSIQAQTASSEPTKPTHVYGIQRFFAVDLTLRELII